MKLELNLNIFLFKSGDFLAEKFVEVLLKES